METAERCPWCGNDPLYVHYHDTVWGRPEYDDLALFEKLCLDGKQAGLSWITILRKQHNYRAAYDDFNPAKIVRYDAAKVCPLHTSDAAAERPRVEFGWHTHMTKKQGEITGT